jgi:hypothetical protein
MRNSKFGGVLLVYAGKSVLLTLNDRAAFVQAVTWLDAWL